MTRQEQLSAIADALTAAELVSGFATEEDAPEGYLLMTGILTRHPEVLISLVDDGEREDDADEDDADEDEPHFAPEWLLERLGAAEQHLRDAAEVIAGPAGAEGWTGWSPEIAFFGDLEWSIRFATAPEGGELGVLVTLTDTEITGAQSLDAEGDPGDERERGDADPDE